MAELARGTVLDRPWGRTLAALGLRGVTGQLTVIADGKPFRIAFSQGAVIAAHSPLASDAAVRIALTGHLISSTQVADITRRQAAAANRDEIDVIAEAAKLAPDQAMRLRRRVTAARAARTFALERGEFVVRAEIELPIVEGSELDIRSIIYLGAKQMLSEARLNSDLGQLGAWFQIKPEAAEDLPQFGFGPDEQAILSPLFTGAGLAELETPHVDQRIVRAVVYALVSCNTCVVDAHARPQARPTPPESTAKAPARPRTPTAPRKSGNAIPTTRAADPAHTAKTEKLIKARLAVIDQHGDHFALLGLTREATSAQIKEAYFSVARQLHPDRLSSLGISDEQRRAQRLFAEINTAFATLSDTAKRDAYLDVLDRGGEAAIRAEQAKAEEIAHKILESEEAFRRGEMALRRDQITTAIDELERAIALNPDEPDYHATLAWAKFCGAPDKMAIAPDTRSSLETAIRRSPKAITARFFLARVERMLGKDHEALRLFQEVLRMSPNHAEATSEVRVLESRIGSDKGGLFFRIKR